MPVSTRSDAGFGNAIPDTRRLAANGRWPADIELWHLRLPMQIDAFDWDCLSRDEGERALRFRRPADRLRFVVTRSRLRQLLAGYLGRDPASLQFCCNARGKPELAGGGLSFNVSHGAAHGLIALCPTRCLGVDVEWIDPALDWRVLSGLLCTATERQAIGALVPESRRIAFFRCWTAKEALLKAHGQGIGTGLHSVDLVTGGGRRWPDTGGETDVAGRRLRYRWLDEVAGYSACLAYGEPGSAGYPVSRLDPL